MKYAVAAVAVAAIASGTYLYALTYEKPVHAARTTFAAVAKLSNENVTIIDRPCDFEGGPGLFAIQNKPNEPVAFGCAIQYDGGWVWNMRS